MTTCFNFRIFQLRLINSDNQSCSLIYLWSFNDTDVFMYCHLMFVVKRQQNVFDIMVTHEFLGKVYPNLSGFTNLFKW